LKEKKKKEYKNNIQLKKTKTNAIIPVINGSSGKSGTFQIHIAMTASTRPPTNNKNEIMTVIFFGGDHTVERFS